MREGFYVLSFLLISFFVFEYFWADLVRAYVNINLVLISWLIVGIFTLVYKIDKNKTNLDN